MTTVKVEYLASRFALFCPICDRYILMHAVKLGDPTEWVMVCGHGGRMLEALGDRLMMEDDRLRERAQ